MPGRARSTHDGAMRSTDQTTPAPSTRHERGRLWRSRWAAIGAAVAVSLGAGGFVGFVNAASSAPSDVVSITPVRVLDTRDPVNVGLAGPFTSPVAQDLQLTGVIPTTGGAQSVVPAGATSVVLNVTAVNATADGFISVRPADAPGAPATSNLNFKAGDTTPNAVIVQIPTAGADAGKIDITYDALGVAGPTTDILIDVMGYTVAASTGPLFAVVDVDGSLERSSPGVTSQALAGVPAGRYAVTFDRDISACSYQATGGRPGVNVGPSPLAFAMVANWVDSPTDSVIVFMKGHDGLAVNQSFHLTVTC